MLGGCYGKEDSVKGAFDLNGIITNIDSSGNRFLVEDREKGNIWVTLNENGNITNYEIGQEIVVWVDGEIRESSPAQAKALNVELIHK